MALLDTIKDGITRIIPASKSHRNSIPPMGIGNAGAGHANFEDDFAVHKHYIIHRTVWTLGMSPTSDQLIFLAVLPFAWAFWLWMIVSKPMIVFHTSQIFFNFLAMCCFASVAAFQAKWHIGPSGLSGLAIFLSILGMILPLFMLLVPVAYEKYDKVIRLARALKEVRVGFILTGAGSAFSLLIAFATTISAFTEAGCKDASKDPNASKGDAFKAQLPGWCSTKKAGAIFFWGAFIFWTASLVLLILDWRSGKLHSNNHSRDPPFTHPQQEATEFEMDYDPDEDDYHQIPPARRANASESSSTYDPAATSGPNPFSDANRYAAPAPQTPVHGRPSIDAYGAFSDPAPSGFSPAAPRFGAGSGGAPVIPEQDLGPQLGVSRTMQYADPYAAVRASIATPPAEPAPGYNTGYQGYR